MALGGLSMVPWFIRTTEGRATGLRCGSVGQDGHALNGEASLPGHLETESGSPEFAHQQTMPLRIRESIARESSR